jgi:hypothetical protein
MSTHKTMVTNIICALACVVLLSVSARAALVWDPSASTYDGTSFVVLQPGVGAVSLGFPGPANPVGTMVEAAGIQAFAFATAVPEGNAIAPGLTDLSASPLFVDLLRAKRVSIEYARIVCSAWRYAYRRVGFAGGQ